MKKYVVLAAAAAGILMALPAQAGDAKAGEKCSANANLAIMSIRKRTKPVRILSILLAAPLVVSTDSNIQRR